MPDYRKKFIALDLETTHLDMREGRIMEVGAVEAELYFDEGKARIEVSFGKSFSALLNPETEPSEEALILTSITREELKSAPLWKDVKAEVKKFLSGQTLLGHNLDFDLEYLKNQGLTLKNSYLDTLEIAQTVAPLLPAHSLEYLAEEFVVSKEASHRALGDAKNCVLVLAAVLNEFLRLPEELQDEVRDYLSKSKLSFRDLILELPTLPLPLPSREGKIKNNLPLPSVGDLSAVVEDKGEGEFPFDFPDKSIVSLPFGFKGQQELLNHLAREKGFLVAVSHPEFLDFIPKNQQIAPPFAALCEKRLERLAAMAELPDLAYKILIKLAIYRKLSRGSFDLQALKWTPEERDFLPLIKANSQICPQHRCGYMRSLEKPPEGALSRFLVLPSLFSLLHDWSSAPLEQALTGRLLAWDLGKIEDEFAESLTQVVNLQKIRTSFMVLYPLEKGFPAIFPRVPREVEETLNELDLFFGILHLVYLRKEGEFAENVVLDEQEEQSERFGKLFHPCEKLLQKLMSFGEYLKTQILLAEGEVKLEHEALWQAMQETQNFLQEFFEARQSAQKNYWFRFNSRWVDLNAAPRDLSASWRLLEKKFQSVSLIDIALPPSSLTYFQNRLGIQNYEVEQMAMTSKPRRVKVHIFSKPQTEDQITELLRGFRGRSIVVLPNETKLSQFYLKLSAEHGEDQEVLAYKFSGSPKIVQKKFRDRENALLLLTTNAFLRFFGQFPPANNLALLRLPFEAPGKRPRHSAESPDQFATEVLPRAVHVLHRLVSRFLATGGENQEIFFFDPRVLADYDQAFVRYFEGYSNFEISTA